MIFMNRPTPDPSQEGSTRSFTSCQLHCWERLGERLWSQCRASKPWGPSTTSRFRGTEPGENQCAELKEVVDDNAKHTERSLVFQTFGGFVQFLQRELRVFVEAFVVDQFANRTLALVDLLENFPEVRQGGCGFLVECVVLGQFAERAFAFVDFNHDIFCLADGGFYLGSRLGQVGDGGQRRLVKRVLVD